MKLLHSLTSLTLAFAGFAHAAPVTPLAFTSGLNTGYAVSGNSSVDGNMDWFVFDSNGTTPTTFYFNRTVAAPDLIVGLYSGDTTGFDYAAVTSNGGFSYYDAANLNSNLTFISWYDDSHDDALGGPFGDPDFSLTLASGRYSLVLSSLNSSGGTYEFRTNAIDAGNRIPEPGSLALLGLGLVGLVASRRRKFA